MLRKIVSTLSLVLFLFLATGTATAAPESFQQFYPSINEFGLPDSVTSELLTYEESDIQYVVQTRVNGSTEVFQVIEPWGEFVPVSSFGNSAVDAAIGNLNSDNIHDIALCYTNGTGEVWYGQGNGFFTNPDPITGCNGIDIGQLDNQFSDDIVAATDDGNIVLTQNPNNPAHFDLSQIISPTISFNDIDLGSLIGPELDLVAVADDTEIVMSGVGDGTFITSNQPLINLIGGNGVLFEDYNGDGHDDVFITSDSIGHAYNADESGQLHLFVIPDFNHACNSVSLGFFDDEPGKDIIFACNNRAWFYTGVQLQDWGQEFVGGSSVISIDLDADGDDDFIIGRLGGTNLPFKGGPIRTVFTQEYPSLSIVLETGQSGYLDSHMSFTGNGPRQWTMECTESWLTCDSEGDYGPTFTGASWTAIVDATGLPAGIHNGTVTIITNDPEREEILVPVQVVVTAAEITVNTTSIIETVGINGQKTVDLSVSNTGTAGVWVTPSDDSNWISFVTAPFFLMPGESKTLAVTLTGASENGTVNGQIFLTTNKTYLTPIEIQVNLTTTGFQIFLPMVVKP